MHQVMTVPHPAAHAGLIDTIEQSHIRSDAEAIFQTAGNHDHADGRVDIQGTDRLRQFSQKFPVHRVTRRVAVFNPGYRALGFKSQELIGHWLRVLRAVVGPARPRIAIDVQLDIPVGHQAVSNSTNNMRN